MNKPTEDPAKKPEEEEAPSKEDLMPEEAEEEGNDGEEETAEEEDVPATFREVVGAVMVGYTNDLYPPGHFRKMEHFLFASEAEGRHWYEGTKILKRGYDDIADNQGAGSVMRAVTWVENFKKFKDQYLTAYTPDDLLIRKTAVNGWFMNPFVEEEKDD